MKVKKGYLPWVTGRPGSELANCPVVSPLQIPLVLAGQRYTPVVQAGAAVHSGEPLARLETSSGQLSIPAPYSGVVIGVDTEHSRLSLNVTESKPKPWSAPVFAKPAQLDDRTARQHLAAAGIWPAIWDSASGGVPGLDAVPPKAIVVNCVCTEPFRARGNVILANYLPLFLQGLGYLERISAEFAPTYLILTSAQHPLAQQIKKSVAGLAWVRPIFVPLVYPLADNRYLWRCLSRSRDNLHRGDSVWLMETQTVLEIAGCLGQGLVPSRRVVSLGGPGYPQGKHYSVPIGASLTQLCADIRSFEGLRILRGGFFTGKQLDHRQAVVGHQDDGFTFLPEQTERKFLSFIRAGWNRPSYTPAYLSFLRRKTPLLVSTALNGEPRACIACGHCERICPVDIMPHLIWRFLGKDLLEEAQIAGAEICVECGLCSYVCPSKIELTQTISQGLQKIHREFAVEHQTQEAKA